MVTTVRVLFSERQPGKPGGGGAARRAAARRSRGVLGGEVISRVLVEPELWEQRGAPKDQFPHHFTHKSQQVKGPLGSPPCQAEIMAAGKNCTAPSDNDFTAYQACPGPRGPNSHPLLCPMSDHVSGYPAQKTQ